MNRVIYLADQLNNNKFKFKSGYRGHGIYRKITPSGYIVHQEWAVVREDDGFTFMIGSYNNICYDEVLDAIDRYVDYGKYEFKATEDKQHGYYIVHPSSKEEI